MTTKYVILPDGNENHEENWEHLKKLRESYKVRKEPFVALELWRRPDGPPFVEKHISEDNIPSFFEFYLINGDRFKEAKFKNQYKGLLVSLSEDQQKWLFKIRSEQPLKATRPTGPTGIMLSDSEFEASISALSPDEQEKAKADMLRYRLEKKQYVDARNSREKHIAEYLRKNRTS